MGAWTTSTIRRNIVLQLHQNRFAPDGVRNELVPLTTGIELAQVAVGGATAGAYRPRLERRALASYDKIATVLVALRARVGEKTFLRAYREYGWRWVNKHPTPYDFWNSSRT
ncbi:MAG: hypothetical protein M3373_02480 [Gemmatimonadota bacterium]|nr:hypothetical protein [Gemmatimonadota bacterium]